MDCLVRDTGFNTAPDTVNIKRGAATQNPIMFSSDEEREEVDSSPVASMLDFGQIARCL